LRGRCVMAVRSLLFFLHSNAQNQQHKFGGVEKETHKEKIMPLIPQEQHLEEIQVDKVDHHNNITM
jgi:hypothetical protein